MIVGYRTSSVAIGWPLEVPCTAILDAVVAKAFLCWFRKDAAGRIADREVIRGAVREAIRREETRDEAIMTIRYLYVCRFGWTGEEKLSRTQPEGGRCRSSMDKRPGCCQYHGWTDRGRQEHTPHVMLTMGSIGQMWRAFEELKLPNERDGLGIEHSGDIMGYSGGTFSAIHPVVAIRR